MTIHPRLLAYLRQALDGVVHADTCFLVFCPGQRSRRIDEAHEPAEVLVRLRGFVIRSDVLAPRYFVGPRIRNGPASCSSRRRTIPDGMSGVIR